MDDLQKWRAELNELRGVVEARVERSAGGTNEAIERLRTEIHERLDRMENRLQDSIEDFRRTVEQLAKNLAAQKTKARKIVE